MSDNDYNDIERLADDILADSAYDTDLGKRMATDARRVADGQMTRTAFEEKYADAVAEEFDTDLHDATADDDPTPGIRAAPGQVSRRSVLKASGAVAVGTAVAGARKAVDPSAAKSEGESVQRGMVLDTEKCVKCLSCVQACKEENHTPEGHFWMQVHRYQRADREYDGPTDCESLQRPCQHCTDAPCVEVCPNNSRFKTENGRTVCNYDTCLGCKYCEVACPYHVNAFVYTEVPEYLDGQFDSRARDEEGRWVAGTPPHGSCSKCTWCIHREWDPETRGTTACEEACPVGAIQFGDLNDPESDPNTYLEEVDESNTFQAQDEVASPNVTYVGDEPTDVEVTPVPGPTTHEDLGLEDSDPTH